ncbi:hypothetical protein QQF64_034488 [Cirrhinus molitorella]|uniref:Ig-like domain-containing protein n=1 Tax=Cirrhinus molitorella TaxID=172907 RepID=A0ABR3L5Q8_9TELE
MHMHSAVDMIYPLILSGILLHITGDAGINTLNIGVKSGSPGIIPCLYDKIYEENRKYWLQWKNLQISDSGYYWCAVEIVSKIDAGYYLYLTVQSVPDVSVASSSVSGHEGGDISVQCFYRSGYKDKPKQWCRFKDKGCYNVGRTYTFQNPSVQISEDDGRRSFTVLMTGLRLTDSGWYFCSVGDRQVPVQLTVTKPKREFTTIPAATPSDSETDM